jgi:imidazolonepropionase-like amidohydrolase
MNNSMMIAGAALVCAVGFANAAPNVPQPAQRGALMIVDATLYPVSSAPIANGRMLVENGRIVAIGDATSVPDRPGATVISLKGKRVYPGLISANTTLGLTEVSSVRATVDTAESGAMNPNARALVAINADSELLPVARSNGVLAALSVPRAGPAGLIAGTSALVQLDGWNWEEMGLIPEVALHVTLPSMRLTAAQFPTLPPQRLEEIQRMTAERLRALEDAFEAARAYAKARASEPTTALDSRWEAMVPVVSGKRPVFITANELPQIRYALNFAERFGLSLTIVGGQDAWRVAELLRERNVGVIIAGMHRLPLRREEETSAPFQLATRLAAAGVRFCIARGGTEFDAANERNLPFDAGTAAAHGLARDEALKAITLYPAQMLGAAEQLGSLEKGKLATFFVTDGDPLEIRTQVERHFIKGRDIPLGDRHTTLHKKYEERYRQLGTGGGSK